MEYNYDLFVSYAEADSAWVKGYLLDALRAAGVAFHSEATFELGAPRLTEFERAIAVSRHTLLVLSPAYFADNTAAFVDLLAQSYGLDSATWPVIPLILHPVKLPPRLAMLVGLDATDETKQHEALARLLEELQKPLPPDPQKPACPYPGMAAFNETQATQFFGRERESQDLIHQLRLYPFVAVIGPSGSGKSSLVLAGLLPLLRSTNLLGSGDWQIKTMRPSAAPLGKLAETLGVTDAHLFQPNQRTLLVIDQFEEVFTLAEATATTFAKAVIDLIAKQIYVVLTVRSDFYTDLMASPLWPTIRAHRVEIAPLDADGLSQAIVRPAENAGVFIESVLVERLIADAAGEPGVLPLVQETLVLLWDKLERRFLPLRAYEHLVHVMPRSAYNQLDQTPRTGLQVAMAARAETTLTELDTNEQDIARRIFLRLVQFGEGRVDTRRQQTLEQLRSVSDDPATFEHTLQAFVQKRLLTISAIEDSGEASGNNSTDKPKKPPVQRVDLAHEALITGWPTFHTWLAKRRVAEQTRRRLVAQTQAWLQLDKRGGYLDGVALISAEHWLQSADGRDAGIDADTQMFVRSCRAKINAENRAKWLRPAAVVGILVVIGLVVWFGRQASLRQQARALNPLIPIAGGMAIVGTDAEDAEDSEKPQRQREVQPFLIEQYEVSNAQYQLCVDAWQCEKPASPIQFSIPALADHPVVGVTALQAATYCAWLGRRLPTEWEWEMAARGVTGRTWPWGEAPITPERANTLVVVDDTAVDTLTQTMPVNALPAGATPEGVFNVAGNVWEWTSSYQTLEGITIPVEVWDGRRETLNLEAWLVQRGGSWNDELPRITQRLFFPATTHRESLGMRCAESSARAN